MYLYACYIENVSTEDCRGGFLFTNYMKLIWENFILSCFTSHYSSTFDSRKNMFFLQVI